MKAKKIVVRLEDINYIPEYKIEEQQRRINEVERQENEAERQAHETERIALYEDMQEKLETGYFNGEDGYSPSASVSKSGNTTTITVTDKEGTTTASVLDGVDGTDGSDGQDAKINGVNTLTIEAGSNITLEQEGSTLTISSTGGGTSDYSDLSNKPKINNVELSGNKTTSDLGIDIPDVSNFITKDVNDLTYYTKTSSLANVATSGSYNDLSNKPTIPTVPTNVSAFTNDAGYTTNTGTITSVKMNGSTISSSGEADLGTVITQHQDISGKQDTLVSGTNIKTINNNSILGSGNLTISGGTATDVQINGTSITSSGTANIITEGTYNSSTNKIATISDLPPEVTETTVSNWGFTKNTGTYSKPSGGIPKTDLASAVQTSLGKADTALQSFTETDPVFSASASAGISSSDITSWNGKQDALVSGTNIKTINSTSILGSGNITALDSSLIEQLNMIVTYTDNTTETIKLVVYR